MLEISDTHPILRPENKRMYSDGKRRVSLSLVVSQTVKNFPNWWYFYLKINQFVHTHSQIHRMAIRFLLAMLSVVKFYAKTQLKGIVFFGCCQWKQFIKFCTFSVGISSLISMSCLATVLGDYCAFRGIVN